MRYSKIKFSSKIKVRDNQPDCILVFDPERDFFYEFNSTGSELFFLLKEGKSLEDIVEVMKQKYGLSSKEAKTYLESFIDRLVKLRIINAQD